MRAAIGMLAVWTLAAFLARGALGDLFEIKGIQPDLLTLVVVYWALALGPIPGTIAGFVVGLVADAELGRGLGVQAGLLSIVGFIVGQAGKRLVKENLLMQATLLATSTVVLAASRILLAGGGDPAALVSTAWGPILGQAVYTALIGPLFYWVVRILGLPDPLASVAHPE
jgi:rod shape-determining protein MreD